jgi:hypothetical protein
VEVYEDEKIAAFHYVVGVVVHWRRSAKENEALE